MEKYRLTKNGVLNTETGASIPNHSNNRHWQEYQRWLVEGNTPDPVEVSVPPTSSEIYDQTIQNSKVLKALVLAINDGTIVPGANVTPGALKTAIKSKM